MLSSAFVDKLLLSKLRICKFMGSKLRIWKVIGSKLRIWKVIGSKLRIWKFRLSILFLKLSAKLIPVYSWAAPVEALWEGLIS